MPLIVIIDRIRSQNQPFLRARRLELRATFRIVIAVAATHSDNARRHSSGRITMGLMDFIRGQLIEIIEFNDDSRDTLSWRFPDSDREIKRGAQLIVRESQVAQFVYVGQFGDTFGPGKHELVTDNIPILSTLKG